MYQDIPQKYIEGGTRGNGGVPLYLHNSIGNPGCDTPQKYKGIRGKCSTCSGISILSSLLIL